MLLSRSLRILLVLLGLAPWLCAGKLTAQQQAVSAQQQAVSAQPQAVSAQPQAAMAVWTLQSNGQVTIDSPIVRLKDVAKAVGVPVERWESLGELVVALVPPDGRGLSLQRQELAEAFARRIHEPISIHWSGPDLIAVSYRPPAEVPPAEVPAVEEPPAVEPPAAAAEPAAAVETAVAAESAVVPAAYATAEVAAPAAPAVDDSRVITARRTMRRGELITAGDLQWETLDGVDRGGEAVRDMESLIGMEVKSGLYKGRPVYRDHVGPPTLIRRGELLELSVIGGGIVIRTGAKAMQDGGDGELIQIETQDPRRRLMARVVAPGSVEIITRAPQVVAE